MQSNLELNVREERDMLSASIVAGLMMPCLEKMTVTGTRAHVWVEF